MKVRVERSREGVDDKGILIDCPRVRHSLGCDCMVFTATSEKPRSFRVTEEETEAQGGLSTTRDKQPLSGV